jgi:hypothetical protein
MRVNMNECIQTYLPDRANEYNNKKSLVRRERGRIN